MARSRFIRPEFFTDDKTGALPFGAQLLFVGSWTWADIAGVVEWNARQFRARLFPYAEGLTSATVAEWMQAIEGAGLVKTFAVGAATYALIVNFTKHQSFTTSEQKYGKRNPSPPWPLPQSEDAGPRSQADPDDGQDAVIPQSDRGQTVVTSPSPSPPPAPPLAPSPGGARAPAAPAALALVTGVDPRAVTEAMGRGDLLGIVRAFGGNLAGDRPGEWQRDAHGLQLALVVMLFGWRLGHRDAIREPSGLRKAREAWKALSDQQRAGLLMDCRKVYGTPEPKVRPESGAA